jgi:hypothetical protein
MQRILLAKQQQRGKSHATNRPIGLDNPEGFGQLNVRKFEKRFIAAATPLAHAAPEALELKRIEVLPARASYKLRRGVEQSTIRLQGLHRVHIHRRTRRARIPTKDAMQVNTVARRSWLALDRNVDNEYWLAIEQKLLDLHGKRGPGTGGDQCGQFVNIGTRAMTGAGTGDTAIVFDTD